MPKRDSESTSREIVPVTAGDRSDSAVAKAILEFVSRIPESDVPRASKSTVEEECRRLASTAANKAALTAGSLALPPGPLGWLTVLPELVAIWRIQGQLVSDIAAAYGKTAKLGREQMLWCLFRHTAAQAFRDIAIRVGDRLVFRTTATSVLQRLAGRIGVSVSKRAVGKGISRWLPVVGALGVGAYAYYDTGQVAKTAIDLFSGEIHIDDGDESSSKTPKHRATDDKTAPIADTVGSHSSGSNASAKKKTTQEKGARARPSGSRTSARKAATKGVRADRVGDPSPKATPRKTVKQAAPKKTSRCNQNDKIGHPEGHKENRRQAHACKEKHPQGKARDVTSPVVCVKLHPS